MRRALAIMEQSFGTGHPEVATYLNNLASFFYATDRLAEAEPLFRRTLAIYEQTLGTDHPNVAIALDNLASLLQTSNRLAEAEPLRRRTLCILLDFARRTGHQHQSAMPVAINNYIQLLSRLGLSEEEITARMYELGREHGIEFGEG